MKLRAKHRFRISIVSFLCVGTLAASLCSCGKKETQDYAFAGTNGDASSLGMISVQVREDGSGTRNQFEEYLGISMSEDNVDKYKDMKQCTVLSSGSAMASAINESISGIGYVWGLDHTGTVFGGICVALAGFGSATATSCAVFGVAKILYDKWKEMSVFRALNDLIRPIVSGLLISVGMSLYGTNCTIEDNAGWGWGSVMILMIGIGIMVYVMQKKKVHMVWQVLASIAVSMVACNAFSVFG